MKFAYILFIGFFGSVLCRYREDKDHKQLHEMAANIMENLQKDHMPSDGSHTGAPNSPLHHFHTIGKHALNSNVQKLDKIKVTVGVQGIKFVSVERNGKVVNITTAFGVGAAAQYSIKSENNQIDNSVDSSEESFQEIDDSLTLLREQYLDDSVSAPNQTKVILAQKAKFDMTVSPCKLSTNSKINDLKVTVNHGYVVLAKTNVTTGRKGYF